MITAVVLAGCGKSKPALMHVDDAKHARIGVMTGSTGEIIVKTRFPQAQMKTFDDIMDAAAALKSGQLDAMVTAASAAIHVVKKNPDMRTLPESLSNEDTAVGVKKENEALLASVDRIIAQLKNDGTLESMKKRWFKTDSSPYEEPGIPLPRAGNPLRIGVSATREPFSFVDKDGRVTGHDGELARRIAAALNRPAEFANMKFMALIPALESGKVDLIVTGMSATQERRKFIAFSQPYFANSQLMLVRAPAEGAGEPDAADGRLATPADLKDKRVAVLLGSAHETYATKNYPDATILQYKSPTDVALAVKSGKADAALYDAEPLREILRENDSMAILGEPLFSFSVGAGFNRNAEGLRQDFNRFLAGIKRNGVYAGMLDRWMEKRDLRMPRIDHPNARGVLVVGVSDAGIPFTVLKDNQLTGFDIELGERFAAFLGREVKFANMDFGSLIAAVSSGKADMIASSIYITEERKKQILFGDPYYRMDTRVFALKSRMAAPGHGGEARPRKTSFLRSVGESFYSNIILENRYLLIWDGLKTTMILSVFSTVFGTLLGAAVCFMRMSRRRIANVPARIYISVLRGTPVLVLLMLIFYVAFASVDINPVLVAVVAFGMNFAAYSSEIFRTGIESVDKGQIEAGIAMGFSKSRTFLYIVLPQTVRRILPVYKGEFISLVKMTSIVGYIAVQDLTKASDIIRSRTFDAFFPLIMVAILYFSISWLLMQSLEYVERAVDPRRLRRKETAA